MVSAVPARLAVLIWFVLMVGVGSVAAIEIIPHRR